MVPQKKAMKVSEVMSATVGTGEFLTAQIVRRGSEHCGVLLVNNVTISECKGQMIVNKGMITDNVCYTLKYNYTHGNGLHRETLSNTNALTDRLKNMFYTIRLSEKLSNISSLVPVIHDPKYSPAKSYELSEFHHQRRQKGRIFFQRIPSFVQIVPS